MKNALLQPSRRALRGSFALLAALALVASCGGGGADEEKGAPGAPAAEPTAAVPGAAPDSTAPPATSAVRAADTAPLAERIAAASPAPEEDPHAGHDHGPLADTSPREFVPNTRPETGGPPARLDVEQAEHDFGQAIQGEVLKTTFHLKSSGPGDLVIASAKPTCGCTVSKLEVEKPDGSYELYRFGDPIPGGTDMRLEAQLDTHNKRNVASSKINIFCNDPRTTVTLGLSAKVDTYFQIAPGSVDFGEVSVSDVKEQTIEVTGKKPGPFLLTLDDKKQVQPGLKVALEPVEPDAEGRAERWRVQVTLGPDAREGNMGYPIELTSDQVVAGAAPGADGEPPKYTASVMVTARVRGLISWEPQYLSFGLVRPGQIVARRVNLKSFDPEFSFSPPPAVRLVGPNDTQPQFKWAQHFSTTLIPDDDERTIGIELTLNGLPDEANGSFQGRMIIETGHPSKPEVSVLFSGVCRPGTAPAGAGGE